MSRGFVKEGDQEEMPIIPPRAILPEGMANYVTPEGLQELRDERTAMEAGKKELQSMEEDERLAIRVLDIKLADLGKRIDTAEVIEPSGTMPVEVRFGVEVSYRIHGQPNTHTFRIVGVDEADVRRRKIAFTAPIARVLMGKKVGEEVDFVLGGESRKVSIMEVNN